MSKLKKRLRAARAAGLYGVWWAGRTCGYDRCIIRVPRTRQGSTASIPARVVRLPRAARAKWWDTL